MANKKLCIFGAGGAAKDALTIVRALGLQDELECLIESDEIWTDRQIHGINVKPFSYFDVNKYKMILAIGDSEFRLKISGMLPANTEFFSLIHPGTVLSPWVEIGEGSIICAGSILTYDIKIGKHAYINVACTISHDCIIGDFFTAAPSVNISGNCTIGKCVFLGTNSSLREKLNVTDGVTIGMGAIVVKNIEEPGIYIGIPARKMK